MGKMHIKKQILRLVLYIAAEFDVDHPPQCAQETQACIPNVEFHLMQGVGAPAYRDNFAAKMASLGKKK